MYNVVLFLHVLAAMLWIGGTSALQVLVLRAKGSGDGPRLGRMSQESEWLGTRGLLPVSILLLVAGTTPGLIGPDGLGETLGTLGLGGFSCLLVLCSPPRPLGQAKEKGLS